MLDTMPDKTERKCGSPNNLAIKGAGKFLRGLEYVIRPWPARNQFDICAPRPALTMRVGVAGHLFLKESELLKATVTDVLRELKAALFDLRQRHAELLPLFNGDSPAPECRIITSLASGA